MDSNHRPAVYETAALPLSYAGFIKLPDTILFYFRLNVHIMNVMPDLLPL